MTLGGAPACACGWRSDERPADRSTALKRAETHVWFAETVEANALRQPEMEFFPGTVEKADSEGWAPRSLTDHLDEWRRMADGL